MAQNGFKKKNFFVEFIVTQKRIIDTYYYGHFHQIIEFFSQCKIFKIF